jgi:hypothetical protein
MRGPTSLNSTESYLSGTIKLVHAIDSKVSTALGKRPRETGPQSPEEKMKESKTLTQFAQRHDDEPTRNLSQQVPSTVRAAKVIVRMTLKYNKRKIKAFIEPYLY